MPKTRPSAAGPDVCCRHCPNTRAGSGWKRCCGCSGCSPDATDAALEGTDTLHGTLCQRLAAHVDLARASAASGEGLRPPLVERFEDLGAMPVTVWIDGQHIRRIRFEHGPPAQHLTTLDLWEFGVPAGDLDWSRLPTFRSPGYEPEPTPWYQRVVRRYGRKR
jgi:hypothetical protein